VGTLDPINAPLGVLPPSFDRGECPSIRGQEGPASGWGLFSQPSISCVQSRKTFNNTHATKAPVSKLALLLLTPKWTNPKAPNRFAHTQQIGRAMGRILSAAAVVVLAAIPAAVTGEWV
jgi:hypothetical protein